MRTRVGRHSFLQMYDLIVRADSAQLHSLLPLPPCSSTSVGKYAEIVRASSQRWRRVGYSLVCAHTHVNIYPQSYICVLCVDRVPIRSQVR